MSACLASSCIPFIFIREFYSLGKIRSVRGIGGPHGNHTWSLCVSLPFSFHLCTPVLALNALQPLLHISSRNTLGVHFFIPASDSLVLSIYITKITILLFLLSTMPNCTPNLCLIFSLFIFRLLVFLLTGMHYAALSCSTSLEYRWVAIALFHHVSATAFSCFFFSATQTMVSS